MSQRTNLGAVTAYADAVAQGYKGTREDFGRDMANFGTWAAQVNRDKTDVASMKNSVSTMQTDVTAKQAAAKKSAEEAKASETNAGNSAGAAAASEQRINNTVAAFDTHVQQKVSESDTAINSTKQAAITAVTNQQAASIQAVKDQTASYITEQGDSQVTRVAAEAATQMSALRGAGGTLEAAVERYYAMRRGKDIYTVEVLDADVTQARTVNRLDGLAGLTCEPSTNTYKGVDEIGALDAFRPTLCNWTLDDEGFQHITAIQGMDNYTEEGPVNVGVLNMGLFYKKERNAEDNGTLHHWSMLPRKDEGYKPMKECIQPDGNIQGWMIHPRGAAVDINGVPYGCNGNPRRTYPSYAQYGYARKQGAAYCFETDMDAAWILALTMIKYGTRDLQAVMRGCTAYTYQYQVAQAEDNTNRVILTTSQANGFVIGSCVSVGDPGDTTNHDRGVGLMHNIADSAMITAIEVVDETHSALVLDVKAPVSVPATAWVSTMHWRSGSTSKVLGYDGSPVSNMDSKNICKINEIEVLPGGYSVCGNSVNIMEADASGATTCKMYRTTDARTLSTNLETIMSTYEEVGTMPVTDNAWKYVMSQECDFGEGYFYPTAYGGGDKTYWADAWHTGGNPGAGTKTGRELLRRGDLHCGGLSGPSFVYGHYALSSAPWEFLATLSPNAVRGEWTA